MGLLEAAVEVPSPQPDMTAALSTSQEALETNLTQSQFIMSANKGRK